MNPGISELCSGLTDLSQGGEHPLPSDFRLGSSNKFQIIHANPPKVTLRLSCKFSSPTTAHFWNPEQTGSLTNHSSPGLVPGIREKYCRALGYSAITPSMRKKWSLIYLDKLALLHF